MKVKVTATVSYETDLRPEHYSDIEGGPKTEDDIIAFETNAIANDDCGLLEGLWDCGVATDIKIEKVEDTAAPAASEAA